MNYKRNLLVLLLILISLIPLFDLFHPGLPVTHDGQDHVARIANFYQNLAEGIIVPRWAGNLNWGYGHPILMFLYPFPSYIVSLFHFLGFSLVDGVKIVFGLAFITSGFAMYLWIRSFLNEQAAVLSAALYMLAPYRFVDLYVRGAIGEHVAFIFPPLICYFLLKLVRNYSNFAVVGCVLSLVGLILSHNAITIMFIPIIFLYASYLIWNAKEWKICAMLYVVVAMLGFGLSSFFLLPAFFEGKYTLRNIVTSGDFSSRFIAIKDFVFGEWNYGGTGYFTVQLGIVGWIMIILAILAIFKLFKKRNRLWILTTGTILALFSSIFIMTEYSEIFWEKITILQKFQFPWRFLSVSVFLISILGGVVIFLITKKIQNILLLLFLGLILFFNKDYWHAKDFLQKPESFYKSVYNSTTDTGESAPIWSVRFMLSRPKAPMEVIDGSAKIKTVERTTTRHVYLVDAKEKAGLRENTLYFPGWFVYDNGKIANVEFQDQNNRGLITFYVEKGMHEIEIKLEETKLRNFSNLVSLFSLTALIIYTVFIKKKLWKLFR